MICLNNTTKFPIDAKWSYLYAIADVYENYSSPRFYKKNPEAPHPLTDGEVIQILERDYNLRNVHRNTISNNRKRLEKYFGYEFGVNKKGKYIKKHSNNIDEDYLIEIAFSIKRGSLLTKDRTKEVLCFLSGFASSPETKTTINNLLKDPYNNCNVDYSENVVKLSKAIALGYNVTFDYLNDKYHMNVKPIMIKKKGFNNLVLECKPRQWSYQNEFDLKHIKNLKVLKAGRPKSCDK